MKLFNPVAIARDAGAPRPDRPALAVLHDRPEGHFVVFRIEPGQQVPPHVNPATVTLFVVEGSGFVSGSEGDRAVGAGDLIVCEPNERHGMRAEAEQMIVLAMISHRAHSRS